MTDPILKITDGRDSVSLISGEVYLKEWRPAGTAYIDGGTYITTPFGRHETKRLVGKKYDNQVETFTIIAKSGNPDALINKQRRIVELLERASDFWVTPRKSRPVWIEARAKDETNTRYAIIIAGVIPDNANPYAQPFASCDNIEELTVIIEHQPWESDSPVDSTCLPLAYQRELVDGTEYKEFLNQYGPAAIHPFENVPSGITGNYSTRVDKSPSGQYNGPVANDILFTTGEDAVYVPALDGAGMSWNGASMDQYIDPLGGGMMFWLKGNTIMWTNAGENYFLRILTSTNAEIVIYHSTTNYEIAASIIPASATGKEDVGLITYDVEDDITGHPWMSVGLTWVSDPERRPEEVRFWLWINGVPVGAARSAAFPPTTWSSNFGDVTGMLVGAHDLTTGADAASARLAYFTIWDDYFITQTYNSGTGFGGGDDTPVTNVQELFPVIGVFNSAIEGFDTTTCEDETFISNHDVWFDLTHVYMDDGGVLSSNLLESSLPYYLLPIIPALNDAVYFGIYDGETTRPFGGLVFDLLIGDGYTITWEYWTGAAWADLGANAQDNTNDLLSSGVVSIHWTPPANWATTNGGGLLPLSTYWIRARVSNTPGVGADGPQQQNRHVYVPGFGKSFVNAEDVGGDYDAKLWYRFMNQSDRVSGATPEMWSNRFSIGLRSRSRGASFTSYLNISDRNRGDIIGRAGAGSSFANSQYTPTGRLLTFTAPNTTEQQPAGIYLYPSMASNYWNGTYHCYLRINCTSSASSELISLSARFYQGGTGTYTSILPEVARTNYVKFTGSGSVGSYRVVDLGAVDLRTPSPAGVIDTSPSMTISIWAIPTATETWAIYDLILIPADEWFGHFFVSSTDRTYGISGYQTVDITRQAIEIDALNPGYLKRGFGANIFRSSLMGGPGGGAIAAFCDAMTSDTPLVHPKADQELWVFQWRKESTIINEGEFWISGRTKAAIRQRYRSHRGAT